MESRPERRHLLSATLEEFAAFCADHELPDWRARQVFEWVYRRGVDSFEAMTNLSKPLRAELAGDWEIFTSTVARRQESQDGTIKLLLEWPDAATSECVLIPDEDRRTACISSQVGCPVGCRFCASGLGGLQRQLTTGEIVEQAMRVRQLCETNPPENGGETPSDPGVPVLLRRRSQPGAQGGPTGASHPLRAAESQRLSNIVFMGLGEPLGNYASVVKAIRIINADWGMNIGARKITVSTVGLPSQIRRLADEDLQINLAISLHAPNDDLRRELIPWAENISIAEIVSAVREHFLKTGREATMEYILLGGVNDAPEHADQLARVCRQMRCNVNLIRYNPVAGLGYARPTSQAAQRFLQRLRDRGVNAHLRKSRGMDIDAACGQLRRAAGMQPGALAPSLD